MGVEQMNVFSGRVLIYFTGLLWPLFFSAHSIAAEPVYTFGVVPQFDSRTINKTWRPILQELKAKTGYRFQLRGAADIPSFENEIAESGFDFVYMNPYHMIVANEEQGYIPLVRDVGRGLHGVLVVNKNGKVKTLKDLDRQVVAFPAPNALGASLLIRAELKEIHGLDIKPLYVNTHTSAFLNVVLGTAAAAGGVQKTLDQQPPQIGRSLEVLYKTRDVAPHPIAVHPRVPFEVLVKVKTALLEMGKSTYGKELLSKVPIQQIGEASIADYAKLKEMGLNKYYVK